MVGNVWCTILEFRPWIYEVSSSPSSFFLLHLLPRLIFSSFSVIVKSHSDSLCLSIKDCIPDPPPPPPLPAPPPPPSDPLSQLLSFNVFENTTPRIIAEKVSFLMLNCFQRLGPSEFFDGSWQVSHSFLRFFFLEYFLFFFLY